MDTNKSNDKFRCRVNTWKFELDVLFTQIPITYDICTSTSTVGYILVFHSVPLPQSLKYKRSTILFLRYVTGDNNASVVFV